MRQRHTCSGSQELEVWTHSFLFIFIFVVEKLARGAGDDVASKDGEELDQVTEDEIGDRIAAVRESELLYGPDSLLALYRPLLICICGQPDQFKVRVWIILTSKRILTFLLNLFSFFFSEYDVAGSGDALVQQIPLRELTILRCEPPTTLPHLGDIVRREHPEQHRHRARWRRFLVQHDR